MPDNNIYRLPFEERYSSREMLELFSNQTKFRAWRRLWIALAEAENELGLPVSKAQIAELKKHANNINFDTAAKYEKELRHDVMAHIRAFADQCPSAGKIIHLGATSAFVTDNTDLIQMRDGLELLRHKLLTLIKALSEFAAIHSGLPVLAYTHLQPAQFTTLGKRTCLWIQDLLSDLRAIEHAEEELRFLGVKGATGTQASFLELFKGDEKKVRKLDALVAKKMGFKAVFTVTGQTYPRKVDDIVLGALASLGVSASKFGNDIRLMQSFKEVEEPFESSQVGSSAMAYKRNPMRSERLCSLSRFLMNLQDNTRATAAVQWFERTLDDSANKRLTVPQGFLCCDAILMLYTNIASGLTVNDQIISKRLSDELPFIATENILMEAAQTGLDRQKAHERIRQHSMKAANRLKSGGTNDLFERLKTDDMFAPVMKKLEKRLQAKNYVGMAPSQTDEFLKDEVHPVLKGQRSKAKTAVDEIKV